MKRRKRKRSKMWVGRCEMGSNNYEISTRRKGWTRKWGFMENDFYISICQRRWQRLFPHMKLKVGEKPVPVWMMIVRAKR